MVRLIQQLRKLLNLQSVKLVLLGKIPRETLTLFIWVKQEVVTSRRFLRNQVMSISSILVKRFHEIYASS